MNTQELGAAAFHYDMATFTAMWTFLSPLDADKWLIHLREEVTDDAGNMLDGEWITGQTGPSGDGGEGGHFQYRFNMLPGDVDQDETVFPDDVNLTRAAQGQMAGMPGYSHLLDVNGSGSIFATDVVQVRNRQFTLLPGSEPVPPIGSGSIGGSGAPIGEPGEPGEPGDEEPGLIAPQPITPVSVAPRIVPQSAATPLSVLLASMGASRPQASAFAERFVAAFRPIAAFTRGQRAFTFENLLGDERDISDDRSQLPLRDGIAGRRGAADDRP